jgi:hypothetical protein
MRNCLLVLGLVGLLPLAAAAAEGDSIKGRWSFTAHAGVDVEVSGRVHDSGTGTVLALPTSVSEKTYKGYGISDRVEFLADLLYSKVSSKQARVGNVAGLALDAKFADYREAGWSLGARYFLTSGGRLRPHLTAWATMSQIDNLPATFTVPAAGVTLADTPFYDKSVVFGGGGDFGLSYSLSRRLSLGVSAGLRYQSKPKGLEGLAGTGLENLNDVGSRWYAPVALSTVIRF